MKSISYLTLCLLLITPTILWGQQYKGINQVLEHLDASKGLKVEFTMTDLSTESGTSTGTYYALGRMFYIEMSELKAWYDGTNLWVYIAQNGEINLSKPADEDLADINPLTNINRLKGGDFQVKSRSVQNGYIFDARPSRPRANNTITSIEVAVDKTYKPLKMTVNDKALSTPLVVEITKINKGEKLSTDLFKYEVSKAPGVTVIDLR